MTQSEIKQLKKELAQLSESDLQAKLGEVKKTYQDLKMAHAISPLEDNPLQLRYLRRTVARINTEITKRGNQ